MEDLFTPLDGRRLRFDHTDMGTIRTQNRHENDTHMIEKQRHRNSTEIMPSPMFEHVILR